MAKVRDRHYVSLFQISKRFVRERPVQFVRTKKRPMQRRAITQEFDLQFIDKIKVLPPSVVVTAFLHFIDTTAVNTRCAALNSRREHKRRSHNLRWAFA